MSSLIEYIDKLEKWDQRTFLKLYKSDFSKRTKTFAQIFSFFGSLYFWGLIWIGWFIYGYITKDYYLLVFFTGGFDQSIIIHSLIRYGIIKRNRPYITLKQQGVMKHDDFLRIPYIMRESEQKSFPSGHVTFFLFFGMVFAYFFNSWLLFSIFLGLSVVMAISRLILGVHFPIDVIFGFTYIYWVKFYYWIGPIFSKVFHFWK